MGLSIDNDGKMKHNIPNKFNREKIPFSEEPNLKRLLLIMNPMAGTKKANPHLHEILTVFRRAGYECLTFMTLKRGDGTELAAKYADSVDLIVCIGGDGTFNEIISGVCSVNAKTPIGYIPAGSTNDFASSLNLSKDVVRAARDIVEGRPINYDVGRFQNRFFTYVASFGAFTKTSYATSQSVKNVLGHMAYLLGGVKELTSLHRCHVETILDGKTRLEGDYIFGAISNSTSVGGILTLDPEIVDLNDGLFEVMYVKYPSNISQLTEIIRAITTQDYNSPMLSFHPASYVTVHADPSMDWTLDGEFAKGEATLEIENLRSAIRLMVND